MALESVRSDCLDTRSGGVVTNEAERHTKNLIAFWKDESGATAIEYGLIAAGIALAIITVVNGLGTAINEKFSLISSSLR